MVVFVGAALALALGMVVAGGSALYRQAVVLPRMQAHQKALDAQHLAEIHAREVDRTVGYARCLQAVGSNARATRAEQCQKLGQGADCELPNDTASALDRQHERGEVQCFNDAKIGL